MVEDKELRPKTYSDMEETCKLNLGSGDDIRIGWENIDRPTDFLTLEYPEGSIDAILLNHVAMYIRPEIMDEQAKKWYSWLKKGGTIHIETQNLDKVRDPETLFGMGKHSGHTWAWTPESLSDIFKRNGFIVTTLPGILHGKPERDFLLCAVK